MALGHGQDGNGEEDVAFFRLTMPSVYPVFMQLYSVALMEGKSQACVVVANSKGLRFTVEASSKNMACVAQVAGGWEEFSYGAGAGAVENTEVACRVKMDDLLSSLLLYGQQSLQTTTLTMVYVSDRCLTVELEHIGLTSTVEVNCDMEPETHLEPSHGRGKRGTVRGDDAPPTAPDEHASAEDGEEEVEYALLQHKYAARMFDGAALGVMSSKINAAALHDILRDATSLQGGDVTMTMEPDPAVSLICDREIPPWALCLTAVKEGAITITVPRSSDVWKTTPHFQVLPPDSAGRLPYGYAFNYPVTSLAATLRALALSAKTSKDALALLRINSKGVLAILVTTAYHDTAGRGGAPASPVQFYIAPCEDYEDGNDDGYEAKGHARHARARVRVRAKRPARSTDQTGARSRERRDEDERGQAPSGHYGHEADDESGENYVEVAEPDEMDVEGEVSAGRGSAYTMSQRVIAGRASQGFGLTNDTSQGFSATSLASSAPKGLLTRMGLGLGLQSASISTVAHAGHREVVMAAQASQDEPNVAPAYRSVNVHPSASLRPSGQSATGTRSALSTAGVSYSRHAVTIPGTAGVHDRHPGAGGGGRERHAAGQGPDQEEEEDEEVGGGRLSPAL